MGERDNWYSFPPAPKPVWKAQVWDGLDFFLSDNRKAPNVFHRAMFRLFFGIKWERISK